MSDIAIRVENCILSRVEGLSKLYRIGRAQQRHDTLRDLISDFGMRISDLRRCPNNPQFAIPLRGTQAVRNPQSKDLWALKDVSFVAQHGEVLG